MLADRMVDATAPPRPIPGMARRAEYNDLTHFPATR